MPDEASSSSLTLTRVVSRSFQGRKGVLEMEAVLAATAAANAAAVAALEPDKLATGTTLDRVEATLMVG